MSGIIATGGDIMRLTQSQIHDLARPLVGILTNYYSDPKNEEEYQRWLRNVEKEKNESD